jgi:hypothetical protein
VRNLTLKKRFPEGKIIKKNQQLKKFVGSFFVNTKKVEPIDGLDLYLEKKPKTFTLHKWLYPFVIINGFKEDKYQECIDYIKNPLYNVVIEISSKLQHLSLCFESKHFKTCGSIGGRRETNCNIRITSKNVFCCFIRDKAGHVIARRMLLLDEKNKIVYLYSLYGSHKYHDILTNTLKNKIKEEGYIPLEKYSFL